MVLQYIQHLCAEFEWHEHISFVHVYTTTLGNTHTQLYQFDSLVPRPLPYIHDQNRCRKLHDLTKSQGSVHPLSQDYDDDALPKSITSTATSRITCRLRRCFTRQGSWEYCLNKHQQLAVQAIMNQDVFCIPFDKEISTPVSFESLSAIPCSCP